MPVSVTTRSFDLARSGANTAETILTPQAVRARGVKQLLVLETPDDPRLEAQPLYLGGLSILGMPRNVVLQATMGNWIYAWDADTGALIWKKYLGQPIKGGTDIDQHNINVLWGVLSTPVIDRAAGRLYACYWSSPDGTAHNGQHFLAALDIATGHQVQTPLSLEGAEYSAGSITQHFKSLERKQRAALTIAQGAVLIPFGTIAETLGGARGWLIAVDTASWSIAATWCSTVKGSGGGIWMSGAGPAIQSDGTIWLVTGNGDFDGQHDFGESVVRLRYTPPSANAKGAFEVTGWWTPWTDKARIQPDAAGATAFAKLPKRLPSNFRVVPHLIRMGLVDHQMDEGWTDQDLGASGIVLVEELGIGLVSGKDGILYTVRLDNPGDTMPADLAPASARANYGKLAAAPVLYTYYDAAIDPAPANPVALDKLSANRTHHLHGTPLAWKSGARGWMHFCGGENGNLRAWQLAPDKVSAYLACSAAYASAAAGPHGGMPGWSVALSAKGGAGGIVWAMIPYGDANMQITTSRLLAYDAENFGRFGDGSGEIVPLWDSQDWGWNMLHPKFNRPVPIDGKVLVPTYGGQLLVLGLA